MPHFLLHDVLAILRLYFTPQQFVNLANNPEPTPRSFAEKHCDICIILLHTGENVPYYIVFISKARTPIETFFVTKHMVFPQQ